MTALDQAFIKAYQQTGAPPATAPLEFAAPVSLEETLGPAPPPPPRTKGPSRSRVLSALAGCDPQSLLAKSQRDAQLRARGVRRTSRVEYRGEPPVLGDVSETDQTMQQTKDLPAKTGGRTVTSRPKRKENAARKDNASRKDNAAAEGDLPALCVSTTHVGPPASRLSFASLGVPMLPLQDKKQDKNKAQLDDADETLPDGAAKFDAAEPSDAEAALSVSPAAALAEPAPEAELQVEADPEVESTRKTASVSFRPMLQVDNFAWPPVCTKLTPAAAAQIDQLAMGLVGGGLARPRLIGVAGSARGAGCTTLLLGTARRLAERGRKVAMIDADVDDPQLAYRLGLAPEYGWEVVLEGRLPVAEALIESIEDHLVLLPWHGAVSGPSPELATVAFGALGTAADVLANHFDLVLVDLGARESGQRPSPWQRHVEAVVLVHNVRNGRPDQLARARRQWIEAGVRVLGVAENFASAGAYRRAA